MNKNNNGYNTTSDRASEASILPHNQVWSPYLTSGAGEGILSMEYKVGSLK